MSGISKEVTRPQITALVTFKARKEQSEKQNKMIIDRIKGLPAQPGTPESDADPTNPHRR